MAKWIKLKTRVVELREWINLDHALGISLDTTREIFTIRFHDQKIQLSRQEDPEAFSKVHQALTEATPPFVGT